MKNKLLIAAAALLASVTASYAASPTVSVTGYYSLGYVAGGGTSLSDMTFSSAPGDGAVSSPFTYNGASVTDTTGLGSHSLSGQSTTSMTNTSPIPNGVNPFYLDGASHPSQSTLPGLVVGSPLTVNFFTADPANAFNCPGTCVSSISAPGISGSSVSGTQIAWGRITATFTFLTPSGTLAGNFTDSATYAANYNGSLNCAGNPITGVANGSHMQSDCVVWDTSNDPITVNFTDGAVMSVTLNNAIDWNITSTVTFNMTRGPTTQQQGVPEPASLAIFSSAVAGLGLIRRRRNKAA